MQLSYFHFYAWLCLLVCLLTVGEIWSRLSCKEVTSTKAPTNTATPTTAPTARPTGSPTILPTRNPSAPPTIVPTRNPSATPTAVPSFTVAIPTTTLPSPSPVALNLSYAPSLKSSETPSTDPSHALTTVPTFQPTLDPTLNVDTTDLTRTPSALPSFEPSLDPTISPSANEVVIEPTSFPVNIGSSCQPSMVPSNAPVFEATLLPSLSPNQVSFNPTVPVTNNPSPTMSEVESAFPLAAPTQEPSSVPLLPSSSPNPVTVSPTVAPTNNPTVQASVVTGSPTMAQVESAFPSIATTEERSSVQPTLLPTACPSTLTPSFGLSHVPSSLLPSLAPSDSLSLTPTVIPSMLEPSPIVQTFAPSLHQVDATQVPTQLNTFSFSPSTAPSTTSVPSSNEPMFSPTGSQVPTQTPTFNPTAMDSPSVLPSQTMGPSSTPYAPIPTSTAVPTIAGTSTMPTIIPSNRLTSIPSTYPTSTITPSLTPSTSMTSFKPVVGSNRPSFTPTAKPSQASSFPKIRSRSVSTTLNAATINVVLLEDGIVYKKLVASSVMSETLVNSTTQVMLENDYATTQSSMVNISLTGLVPATKYFLYLVTQSLDKKATMRAPTYVSFTTPCCRTIAMQLASVSLVEGVSMKNWISFSVNDAPAIRRKVSVNVRLMKKGTTNDASGSVMVPQSKVDFTSQDSYPVTKTISLNDKLAAGQYILFAKVQSVGSDSDESGNYRLVNSVYGNFSSGIAVTVANKDQPFVLPPPSLQQAIFADDGTSISLSFSAATNQGGYVDGKSFQCDKLLAFRCASSSLCQWTNSKTLMITSKTAGDGACFVNPDDMLQVNQRAVVKAACPTSSCSNYASWGSLNTSSVAAKTVLLNAANPVSPTVVLSAPLTISQCSPISLDLTSSYGSGGRPWKSVAITVSSLSTTNLTALQSFLNNKYIMNPPSDVSSRLLDPKATDYTFSVVLCNFFGKCSSSSKTVQIVVGKTVPIVQIVGKNVVKMTRADSLQLLSSVTVKDCSGSTSANQAQISYSWSVFSLILDENGASQRKLETSLRSTSRDPSRFLLPAFSLQPNSMYQVQLNVSSSYGSSGTAAASSASMQVFVGSGRVVAVMKGGDLAQLSVRAGRSIVVDASDSYDEDKQATGGVSASAGLQFQWICTQSAPTIVANCSSVFDLTSIIGFSSLMVTTSSLSLKTRDSAAGAVVTVSLRVFDGTGLRSSAVSTVSITVQQPLSATISLTMTTSSLTAVSGLIINPSQSLQLEAVITFPSSAFNLLEGNASWSVQSNNLPSFRSIALTPLQQRFNLLSSSGATKTVYLSLAGSTLSGGSSYTFAMTCTLPDPGKPSSATITINVNSPPTSGVFLVQPSRGKEITTSFAFFCNQWVDSNLPLTYQFSYISSSGGKIILKSSSTIAYSSSVLPAGPASRNFTLEIVTDVFDSFGANTTLSSFATVTSLVVASSTGEKKSNTTFTNLAADFISKNLGNGGGDRGSGGVVNVDNVMRGAAIASYLLNQVNCSAAPNCSSLNRKPCYKTAQTCGPCLSSGMIGAPGDSNDACYTSFPTTVTSSKLKQCAGSCSGHGRCIYTSALTQEVLTSAKCFEGDAPCTASCACDEGYGQSPLCDLSDEEVEQKRQLRSSVIDSIQSAVLMQDPTEQSISSWLSNVNEASLATNELTSQSISTILDITNYAISSLQTTGISAKTCLTSLLSTVDDVASGVASQKRSQAKQSQSSLTSRRALLADQTDISVVLLQSLRNYSLLLTQEMVPGQEAKKFTQNNYRLHLEVLPASQGGSQCDTTSLKLPKSSLETHLNFDTPSVTLPGSCSQSGNAQTISLISLSSKLFSRSNFTSDIVSLSYSSVSCTSEGCMTLISLPRTVGGTNDVVTLVAAKNVSVVCKAEDRSTHMVSCPDGNNHAVECGGNAETLVAHCPAIRISPSCSALRQQDAYDIGCVVVSSTASDVTCSCPLRPTYEGSKKMNGEGRRMLTSHENTTVLQEAHVNYVAMMESVAGNFLTTSSSAASINASTVEKSWTVMATLGSLLFVIGVSMILSYYIDKKTNAKLSAEEKLTHHAHLYQSPSEATEDAKTGNPGNPLSDDDFLDLAEEALPQILSSQSLGKRIWNEVKRHHRWLGVVFYFSAKFPRILRVISLSTNIIVMLFVQSLTYAWTNGDDGSCEVSKMQSDCLSRPSAYGMGQTKCQWLTSDNTCHYLPADDQIKVVIFVAIFSSLVTAPLALLTDWLINYILAAPDLAPGGFIASSNASQKMKVVPVSPMIAMRERTTKQQIVTHDNHEKLKHRILAEKDFKDLKKAIVKYRKSLWKHSQVIHDAQQLQEFDNLWALGEKGDLSNWDINRKALSLTSILRMTYSTQKTIATVIKQELLELQEKFDKELGAMKTMMSLMTTKEDREQQTYEMTRKLLFLFQRDLIPGISGEILDNKDQRDHQLISPVEAWKKTLAWATLGAANVGMLFYVFLFAISQDAHHQAAWGQSFAIYLLIEIVLISTFMVILMHIFIPAILMRDVVKIKQRLMESISTHYGNLGYQGLDDEKDQEEENSADLESDEDEEGDRKKGNKKNKHRQQKKNSKEFNAAKFLFLSYRVAEQFSDLKAAQVILRFTTPWPRQSYQYMSDVKSSYNDKFTVVTRSISIIFVFFVTNLLTVPVAVQDLVIHIGSVVVFGYAVLVHIDLYTIFPALVIIPTFIIIVIISVVYFWFKSEDERRMKQMLMMRKRSSDSSALRNDDDNNKIDKQVEVRSSEGVDKLEPGNKISPKKKGKVAPADFATRRQSLQYGLHLASQLKSVVKEVKPEEIKSDRSRVKEEAEEKKGSESETSRRKSDDVEERNTREERLGVQVVFEERADDSEDSSLFSDLASEFTALSEDLEENDNRNDDDYEFEEEEEVTSDHGEDEDEEHGDLSQPIRQRSWQSDSSENNNYTNKSMNQSHDEEGDDLDDLDDNNYSDDDQDIDSHLDHSSLSESSEYSHSI